MSGSVLAVSCRALVAYAEARGHATDAWLGESGLTRLELQNPDARLDPKTIFSLWRQAYSALDDPALALHVAETLGRGAYRAVEYLAAHAPTLGHAYSKVADYFSVIDTTTELVIHAHSSVVSFGPSSPSPDPASYPAIEYMLAACYLRVRDMSGVDHRPITVEFTTTPHSHTAELERLFGCTVLWNQPGDRLLFSASDWGRPTAQADPELLHLLEDHARILKDRYPNTNTLLRTLDHILEHSWDTGDPSLEQVARKLGLSTRTLQRRLGEEGAAFSERVDAARKRATLRWLDCPDVSLAEVAYLVGFKEQASFTRAVRRWTGKTPGELRRDLERAHQSARGRPGREGA